MRWRARDTRSSLVVRPDTRDARRAIHSSYYGLPPEPRLRIERAPVSGPAAGAAAWLPRLCARPRHRDRPGRHRCSRAISVSPRCCCELPAGCGRRSSTSRTAMRRMSRPPFRSLSPPRRRRRRGSCGGSPGARRASGGGRTGMSRSPRHCSSRHGDAVRRLRPCVRGRSRWRAACRPRPRRSDFCARVSPVKRASWRTQVISMPGRVWTCCWTRSRVVPAARGLIIGGHATGT